MPKGLLKWIGNKQRFAKEIISYFPNVFNNYYEPFLGSGAVLAELEASRESIAFNRSFGSDELPFLIEIFNYVKIEPETVKRYYREAMAGYSANPKANYEMIRDRFNKTRDSLDFLLLSRTCYSGVVRFRKADGYMSTPCGPHKPIPPSAFDKRVDEWHRLIRTASFEVLDYKEAINRAGAGDVVYCDPPYTHSQSIIYGAQSFCIDELFKAIEQAKNRGVRVALSINGTRESKRKDISVAIPPGLFAREIIVNCGTSMIDRLQKSGKTMDDEIVHDKLLLTW